MDFEAMNNTIKYVEDNRENLEKEYGKNYFAIELRTNQILDNDSNNSRLAERVGNEKECLITRMISPIRFDLPQILNVRIKVSKNIK